jgi:hypothetical protein
VDHQKVTEDQEKGEDNMTECGQLTNKDAWKSIAGLCLCFMQECNEGSPISVLEMYVNFVQLQSIKGT